MNCLLLCAAASAFAPTRKLQRLPSAAPITQPPRVAPLAPTTTALRYADAGSEPQEAPRTAPLQQLRRKLQTYITKTKLFLKSDEGRKIGAAAAFVFIALLLRALGGMVAAPPAPKRTMPALNFVWNHGEGATLAWRQGEPLKFVWRHGEYVWHVIRPAGRRPYLYLAGAP